MGSAITPVYALIDWHNVERIVSPNFKSDPRKELPGGILKIQQKIAGLLKNHNAASSFRVTLRVYHGWHDGKSAMPIRRDFEQFSTDQSLARRIARVSFTPGFQFGNELMCLDGKTAIFSTHRAKTQKMVDSSIICDLLHILREGTKSIGIILSDDDDFIPAILTARSWKTRAFVIRNPDSDIKHITDIDCSNQLDYWDRT